MFFASSTAIFRTLFLLLLLFLFLLFRALALLGIPLARRRGLLLGLELSPELGGAAKFVQAAADRGLLLVPAGADVVRFVPPLVVKAEQIDAALVILEEGLAEA